MIREAIVLAGGFGTRLRSMVTDLPKPMAPVAGRPFLEYILDDLAAQGIQHAILAVGHLRHTIMEHFGSSYAGMRLSYSEEVEPLGTGGGIRQACEHLEGVEAFVINGDTFFQVDLDRLAQIHQERRNLLTLALKPMRDFDRYGTVLVDADGLVVGFHEKRPLSEGFINGGVYALHRDLFRKELPEVFSFEKEVLEKRHGERSMGSFVSDGLFIDIGIPEDYLRAQGIFQADPPHMSGEWTLFLDRDGVLNRRIVGDYVRSWEQFELIEGVLEALAALAFRFGRIVVVTNQQGIGKGLFGLADLQDIHRRFTQTVAETGGRIDGIFVCPHLADDETCDCRKPKTGMALQAQAAFPEIDFRKSVLVGDSVSDIAFGRALGMHTVQIGPENSAGAHRRAESLLDWSKT